MTESQTDIWSSPGNASGSVGATQWQRPTMYRAVIELDAPDEPLDSERAVRHLVEAIVNTFDLTLIAYESTRFEPIGVTGFGILGESHISVHTWPEYGYAHVELLTCVPLPDSAELRARFPLPDETVVEVRRCEP